MAIIESLQYIINYTSYLVSLPMAFIFSEMVAEFCPELKIVIFYREPLIRDNKPHSLNDN